jgi:hypothetical protein
LLEIQRLAIENRELIKKQRYGDISKVEDAAAGAPTNAFNVWRTNGEFMEPLLRKQDAFDRNYESGERYSQGLDPGEEIYSEAVMPDQFGGIEGAEDQRLKFLSRMRDEFRRHTRSKKLSQAGDDSRELCAEPSGVTGGTLEEQMMAAESEIPVLDAYGSPIMPPPAQPKIDPILSRKVNWCGRGLNDLGFRRYDWCWRSWSEAP